MSKSLEALETLKQQNTEFFYKNCWGGEELVPVLKYKNYFDIVEQDLQRLEELEKENQELDKENLTLKQSVKDTYDASQEIIAELKEELDTFKLAFYTLWKCCNSDNIPSDIDSDLYLEFKCGYESLCFSVTEQEIESIKKATELLDINVKEVLE